MRNKRQQVPLEDSDHVPTLQNILDTIRELQRENAMTKRRVGDPTSTRD